MKDMTFSKCYMGNMHMSRQQLNLSRKPIIATVNGYCLGDGCELAMMCDIIFAGNNVNSARIVLLDPKLRAIFDAKGMIGLTNLAIQKEKDKQNRW